MSGTNCRPPTTIGIIAFDFGDRFLLSMLHWCGIGRRSTPLAYWKVFLLRSAGQVVGVSGLYRQTGTPEMVCWVGGLAFALDFGDKALAHARCIYCGTSPEVSPVKSYGFTPVRRMISQCDFTKAWALKCSEPPPSGRLVKRWMIRTLS